MHAMGLYGRDQRSAPVIPRLLFSFIFGLGLFVVFDSVFNGRFLVSYNVFAVCCGFFGILLCRFVCYKQTDALYKRTVLVLGVGEKAQQLEYLGDKLEQSSVNVIGYVDIVKNGQSFVSEDKIIKVNSLLKFIKQHDIKELVIALDDRRNSIPMDEAIKCKMQGVEIVDIASFIECQLGKLSIETLQPSAVIYSDGFMQSMKSTSKRALDVFVSVVGLVITSPILLVTALTIFIESGGRGSVFYRQQRIGLNGKVFEIIKFRSMQQNAEKAGTEVWAQKNDTRVTKVGSFIRKTRIDEIPQFINVLKGDMSVVGPRPERPMIVGDLTKQIPFYDLRHYARPGITGWAQICYPYGASVEDAMEKLQYDLYYLKNYSVFLDLIVMFQTLPVILFRKGGR